MNNLICKKTLFMLAWGGFFLVQKRVNANNGKWKHICRINSSICNTKVMWLCAMGCHYLTNQLTNLVAQYLKCCYGHSEMLKQCLSSKYFCITAFQNCYTTAFPNSRHPQKQLRSFWGTSHLLYINIIIFSGFSNFFCDI